MRPKTLKLLTQATATIACTSLAIGLLFRGFSFDRTDESLFGTSYSDSVKLEFGPGMGPNLLTPQGYKSNDELYDMISAEFEDKWIGPAMTRRYMSALIAGEGCKSFVGYGDGEWIRIDDDAWELKELGVADRFGDDGSNSNPFE